MLDYLDHRRVRETHRKRVTLVRFTHSIDLPRKRVSVTTLTNKSNPTIGKQANSQPVSGADIVVQSLVNHGVDTIFAYPGGASIPCTRP